MNTEKKQTSEQFHSVYEMFKDHQKPDYELVNIFEIYLPFWFCKRNIIIEKELALDRLSGILLQLIQMGISSHSKLCNFLGIDGDSFVTMQFHYLIKNGLINEIPETNDVRYEITYEGISFLKRKSKLTNIQTVEFDFIYNDLSREYLEKQLFNFHFSDMTKEFVDIALPIEEKKISNEKKSRFSGYKILETHRLPENRIEIAHSNKPYSLNKLDFARFFNNLNKESSFYDFESSDMEAHKRSICFLALEYVDITGTRLYKIRQSKKSVNQFAVYFEEEKLSKFVTEYYKKNPID